MENKSSFLFGANKLIIKVIQNNYKTIGMLNILIDRLESILDYTVEISALSLTEKLYMSRHIQFL